MIIAQMMALISVYETGLLLYYNIINFCSKNFLYFLKKTYGLRIVCTQH